MKEFTYRPIISGRDVISGVAKLSQHFDTSDLQRLFQRVIEDHINLAKQVVELHKTIALHEEQIQSLLSSSQKNN